MLGILQCQPAGVSLGQLGSGCPLLISSLDISETPTRGSGDTVNGCRGVQIQCLPTKYLASLFPKGCPLHLLQVDLRIWGPTRLEMMPGMEKSNLACAPGGEGLWHGFCLLLLLLRKYLRKKCLVNSASFCYPNTSDHCHLSGVRFRDHSKVPSLGPCLY